MKRFLENLAASFLGAALAILVVNLILPLVMLLGIFWLMGKVFSTFPFSDFQFLREEAEEHAQALLIPVPSSLSEMGEASGLPGYTGTPGYVQWLKILQTAGEDSLIRGIVLDLRDVGLSLVRANELRDLFWQWKEMRPDAPVFCYADVLLPGSFLLSTVCDSVWIMPNSIIVFPGFKAQVVFYRDLLDWAGIEAEVFQMREYKGAGDFLVRREFSPAVRSNLQEILSDIRQYYLEEIAKARNISLRRLEDRLEQSPIIRAEEAVELGLIHGTGYWSDVYRRVPGLLPEVDSAHPFISLRKYARKALRDESSPIFQVLLEDLTGEAHEEGEGLEIPAGLEHVVAILPLEGGVSSLDRASGGITSERVRMALRKIEQTPEVSAIVLRVTSPGGDLWTSEEIWKMLQNVSLPLVVSMGPVAASGGYYISLPARTIFAEPTTITGSIGVIATIFTIRRLMEERLRLHRDTVTAGPWADFLSPWRKLSPREREILWEEVERYYWLFVNRVAESRNLTPEQVDALAGGRIYTGNRAARLGLVDSVGFLVDAVEHACALAGEKDCPVVLVSMRKPSFSRMLEDFLEATVKKITGGSSLPVPLVGEMVPIFWMEPLLPLVQKELSDLSPWSGFAQSGIWRVWFLPSYWILIVP